MEWMWIGAGGVGTFIILMTIGGLCSYYDKRKVNRHDKTGERLSFESRFGNRIDYVLDRVRAIENRLDKREKDDKETDGFNKKIEKQNIENNKGIKDMHCQLQCAAKDHGEWVFVKKNEVSVGTVWVYENNTTLTKCDETPDIFIFKCSDCGLEITKTEAELSAAEKNGLKKLNLL